MKVPRVPMPDAEKNEKMKMRASCRVAKWSDEVSLLPHNLQIRDVVICDLQLYVHVRTLRTDLHVHVLRSS